ncbi:MAG: DNA cytosine methyltransferase [Rhodoferax sp.]|nr:DNA cytosine methyltransferase [Rhodoferax sp.]
MKRDNFTLPLAFPGELIIDNFAGGGGTSTGLEAAFGRPVDIAINHNPEALAMHAINHPHTHHLCESVWDVDPIEVTKNQPVGLVWLSPDCKHFSKAKGDTPVEKSIRGLAWVGMRWIATTKPRVMMLENVEEFKTWGPLLVDEDGKARPDPAKKGKFFESFIKQLRAHGYKVEWKELRACDNGALTIRKRLFLVARRDGIPICWPDQTHGAPTNAAVIAGKMLPWRTAAECIDFDLPSNSIFDRKKDLAVNTQRRVAKGLWRHVLTSAKPFIVSRSGPAVAPFIGEHANASNQRNMAADEPLRTICAQVKGGHFSVVAGHITKFNTGSVGYGLDEPMATITAGGTPKRASTGNTQGLVGAHLVTVGYGERAGQDARTQDIAGPLGTVVAGGVKQAIVAAHLVDMGHGESCSTGAKRWSAGHRSITEPLSTVTASSVGSAMVTAFMEQANGGFYAGDGRPVDAPVSTITAAGSNQQLVTAYMVKYYGSERDGVRLSEPMHTLPTKDRMGLVQIIQVSLDCLAPEHRARAKQCAALLHEHLPENFPAPADMVLVGEWVLVDITLRMLKPPELFRAQSFPHDYVIHEIPDPKLLFVDGKQAGNPLTLPRIPLTGTAQVRMCGNSVAPAQAEALARANFKHELIIYGRQAA